MLASAVQLRAQNPPLIDKQYEIKVKYIYYLAAFIQPKPTARDISKRNPVRIAIIGSGYANSIAPVLNNSALKNLLHKYDDGTAIEWKGFKSAEDFLLDAESCHVVYLLHDNNIDKQLQKLEISDEYKAGKPVLIVTEQADSFRKFAAINFYEERSADRIRIQLRKQSLEDRNLQADPKLLSLPGILTY